MNKTVELGNYLVIKWFTLTAPSETLTTFDAQELYKFVHKYKAGSEYRTSQFQFIYYFKVYKNTINK